MFGSESLPWSCFAGWRGLMFFCTISFSFSAVPPSLSRSYQVSIDAIPPPEHWNPGWMTRMKHLDVREHLAYLNSYVARVKSIQTDIEWQRVCGRDTLEAERELQSVG